jgi:hypothetical protein
MDLLFSRYASPFVLIDSLIQTSSFSTYIDDMYGVIEEEKLWDYFLHKVYDMSWGEFLDGCKLKPQQEIDLGATLTKSKNMLQNFNPQKEG